MEWYGMDSGSAEDESPPQGRGREGGSRSSPPMPHPDAAPAPSCFGAPRQRAHRRRAKFLWEVGQWGDARDEACEVRRPSL